jgi:hypothetical protein
LARQKIAMTRQFVYINLIAAEQLHPLGQHLMIVNWFSCDETQ